MVLIYFEYKNCSELVGKLNEDLYDLVYPLLEKKAKEVGATLSESVEV